MKNVKGSLILLVTAIIWGSAFVAQTTGARYVSAFAFNSSRSFVGALFLAGYLLIRDRILKRNRETTDDKPRNKWPIFNGICCGIMLFFSMGLQQYGIGSYPDNVASAGRAGFITATYVVMVAVVEQLRGKKLHYLIALATVGTIVGVYFLCVSEGLKSVYLGDILVIGCAVCFTVHIILVDNYKEVDSVKLSFIQFLTVGVLSLFVSLFTEHVSMNDLHLGLYSILYAGIMSSGIAYTLQMVGQKYAEPAVASIVMSLEAVFSVLTGWLLLNEMLTPKEILGCALVFVSVIVAQLPQFDK